MKIFDSLWLLDHFWLAMTILALVVMLVSIVADRRRNRRKHMENVGFMPWPTITMLSTLATLFFAALAIKVG